MPWPNWILKQFATIPSGVDNATQESLLYGPYNTILHYLFPPEEDIVVVPLSVSATHNWLINRLYHGLHRRIDQHPNPHILPRDQTTMSSQRAEQARASGHTDAGPCSRTHNRASDP